MTKEQKLMTEIFLKAFNHFDTKNQHSVIHYRGYDTLLLKGGLSG